MNKKIILNIVFALSLACAIALLCIASNLLTDINASPQLLSHVIPTNGTPHYYKVEDELINSWKTYCIDIIAVASVAAFIMIVGLVFINIPKNTEAKANRKESQRNKRIAKLEAELEELKKDE